MKNSVLTIILFAAYAFNCIKAEEVGKGPEQQVVISSKDHTSGHDHTEVNPPADMPDVYYNSELDVVTIVDYANVTYYVTIYDDWWNSVITDTKPGGGTINVSSLTSGDYVIEISTSWNHDYEGQFTVP